MTADWIRYAKVGDKVVCVDAANRPGRFWRRERKLVAGSVYTITGIFVSEMLLDPGEILFEFAEMGKFVDAAGRRLGYRACRFRPIQPSKTDISIFTDMLKKAGKRIEETA